MPSFIHSLYSKICRLQKNVNRQAFKLPSHLKQQGFSLIEILLSLFFVAALITIVLTASGSLLTRRQANTYTAAAKIASKEIEKVRGGSFPTITDCANPIINQITDAATLRGGGGEVRISCYQDPGGPSPTPSMLEVSASVWFENQNGVVQSPVTMKTLLYQYGL